MLVEQQENDRRERLEKREKDRQEIKDAECNLMAKKEALCNLEKGPDDEDEEDNEGSKSAVDEHAVSSSVNLFAAFYTNFNKQLCQGTSKTKTKCELEEDACKKAPQTIHSEVN